MSNEKGIVINISGSGEGAAEALRQIETRMRETSEKGKSSAEQLEAAWGRVEKAFGAVGLGLGLTEMAGKAREAVMASAELGESISKVGERTGIAAGALSVMHYAAAITSSDFDTLVKGTTILGRNMANAAEGNKTMAAAFRAAHIDAADLSKRTDGIDQAMRKLGQTLAATESPAKRNQIAMTLLAKAGSENIPVLIELMTHWDEYTERAKAAGVYMDEMRTQKLEKLAQSMADLKQRVEGAEISFTEGMSPALTGVASAFSQANQGADVWNAVGKQAGYVAIEVAASFNYVAQFLRKAKDEWIELGTVGNLVDNAINSKIGFTQGQRDSATSAYNYHRQQLRDLKTDHDSAQHDLDSFNAELRKAVQALDHPQATTPSTANRGSGGGKPAGVIDPGAAARAKEALEKANRSDMLDASIWDAAAEQSKKLQENLERQAAARLQLTEARENGELSLIKSGSQAQLQILNDRHSAGIVGTEEYYAKRLAMTQSTIDKEIDVERDKHAQIQNQIAQLHDPNDEEQLRIAALKKELVASETKIGELAIQRGSNEEKITAELNQQRWSQQVADAEERIREKHRQQESDQHAQELLKQGKEAAPEALNVASARQAAQTISSVMDQMAEGAVRGKISFHQMADSVILDVERMAMKMMEERSIMPLINSLFGISNPGSGATTLGNALLNGDKNAQKMNGSENLSSSIAPLLKSLFNFGSSGKSPAIDAIQQQGWDNAADMTYFAGGGDYDPSQGWAVVGDGGDGSGSELFAPKGPGTILPHEVLEGLAAGRGGGGGAPNVTIQTINNSSAQVQHTQAGVSWDAQAKQFIIQTVLEDANSGGPINGMMSGFARS